MTPTLTCETLGTVSIHVRANEYYFQLPIEMAPTFNVELILGTTSMLRLVTVSAINV